jgi:hypothetical protein
MPESGKRKGGRRYAEGWENYNTVGERYATGLPVFRLWKSLNPSDLGVEKYAGEIDSQEFESRPAKDNGKEKKKRK